MGYRRDLGFAMTAGSPSQYLVNADRRNRDQQDNSNGNPGSA
jgi:hypothetical protein